jgi:hypothetical protein
MSYDRVTAAGYKLIKNQPLSGPQQAALRASLSVASFSESIPSNDVGSDGDFHVIASSGIIYKKIAGVWTAYATSPNRITYAVTEIPSNVFGNNDDLALVFTGGIVTQLLQKSANVWNVLAAFGADGLSIADVRSDRLRTAPQKRQCSFAAPTAFNGGSGSVVENGVGFTLSTGTNVNGAAAVTAASFVMQVPGWAGSGIHFSRPISVSWAGAIKVNDANSRVRMLVGSAAQATAPPAGQSNALAAVGFGLEFGLIGGVSSMRLVAFSAAGGYVEAPWIAASTLAANYCSYRVESDGAGNISLFWASSDYGPAELPLAPTQTLAGGPTTLGGTTPSAIVFSAAAHSSIAPIAIPNCAVGPVHLEVKGL